MMLVEQTTIPSGVLPVAEFKDHLLLGTGFSDDAVQDGVLENYLRAAMAAIEARTGKVLIERAFCWTLTAWRDLASQMLPVAPASAVTALRIIDRLGQAETVSESRYRLIPDTHRPRVVATSLVLPTISVAGQAEIDFVAGYGPAWSDIPADLAQAVFLLAAQFYEHRYENGAGATAMPPGVTALVERYRNVRLFGGGGA